MDATADSLASSMQSEIDSLQILLEKAQSGAWVDYVIIGGFALIALLLVGKFTDSGLKKLLGYLAVLVGSGMGLRWLTKRRLRRVQEAYLKIKDTFAERQNLIEEKDRNIADYRSQIAAERTKAKADKATLAKLDGEIRTAEREYQLSMADIDAKEILGRQEADRFLSKIPKDWLTDATSLKPPVPPLPDPSLGSTAATVAPQGGSSSGHLEINGFSLKGDA